MRFFALISFCVALSGCDFRGFGPGASDFSAPMPNGYFINRTSAHQIFISPQGWSSETPIIPTKVIEAAHDSIWIIAKQQHLQRRSPNNPNDTYEEPKADSFSYWILNTKTPRVWGPLTSQEFSDKKKELGVNSNLELRSVYDFRP